MAKSPAFAANPGHVITVNPHPGRVTVAFKGAVIAETMRALSLKEASYPATIYVPRADCRMEYFVETPRQSKCPFKGTARYWTIKSKDGEAVNAVWGYDDPFDQVSAIDQHVAFYPNHVDIRTDRG